MNKFLDRFYGVLALLKNAVPGPIGVILSQALQVISNSSAVALKVLECIHVYHSCSLTRRPAVSLHLTCRGCGGCSGFRSSRYRAGVCVSGIIVVQRWSWLRRGSGCQRNGRGSLAQDFRLLRIAQSIVVVVNMLGGWYLIAHVHHEADQGDKHEYQESQEKCRKRRDSILRRRIYDFSFSFLNWHDRFLRFFRLLAYLSNFEAARLDPV